MTTLEALASALGAGIPEPLAPAIVPEQVRFRSKKTIKLREHIISEAGRRLSDYAGLEDVLDEQQEFLLADLRRSPPKGKNRP